MDPGFEDSLVDIRNDLPRVWYAIYNGCIKVGFTQTQSLIILQTWMISQAPAGIRLTDRDVPPKPDPEEE